MINDGDGVWVAASELAETLAAALLDLDEGSPPRVVMRDPVTRHVREVTGLRYDTRQHLVVIETVDPTYHAARWLRRDDDPRDDVTFTFRFEPGGDAWNALRFAYGGFVPEPDQDRYARYEDPPDAGASDR